MKTRFEHPSIARARREGREAGAADWRDYWTPDTYTEALSRGYDRYPAVGELWGEASRVACAEAFAAAYVARYPRIRE